MLLGSSFIAPYWCQSDGTHPDYSYADFSRVAHHVSPLHPPPQQKRRMKERGRFASQALIINKNAQ